MIEGLTEGLRARNGEITKTCGTTLNYLGMVLDFSHPGETWVTMKGFVDDMLMLIGLTGGLMGPPRSEGALAQAVKIAGRSSAPSWRRCCT
jgi:hypothetical protein